MDLSSTTVRLLFEAAEATGIDRAQLADGLVDLAETTARGTIEWSKLAALMGRLSELVDGDPERLRAVGAQMVRAPSYEFLRRLARSILSLRALYVDGSRWLVSLVREGEVELPGTAGSARCGLRVPRVERPAVDLVDEGHRLVGGARRRRLRVTTDHEAPAPAGRRRSTDAACARYSAPANQ